MRNENIFIWPTKHCIL